MAQVIDPSISTSKYQEGSEGRHHRHRLESIIQSTTQSISNPDLSCLKLFDSLVSCFNLSSQLKAIYRYSELNKTICDRRLDDFKFCLALKRTTTSRKEDDRADETGIDEDRREEMRRMKLWIDRKTELIYSKPNSEDVWETR
ncbi:hypothetical protein BY996DRAFT_4584690 [Phakopsora pachyrhizi]|nr:hypothetical protein BY996DRAFT_4584690 [Phakopsora pachyrhizi]